MKTTIEIFAKTTDAYSFSRYSGSGWKSAIRVLKSYDLNDEQVEAFLRSKHMRWAADGDEKRRWGKYNGNTLKDYFKRYPKFATKKEVNTLLIF